MARNSEREIFDGCSRPRSKVPPTPQEIQENIEFLKREAARRLANRVGDMVDWTKLYDHKNTR